MDAPAWALIDLGAIRDNVAALRHHVGGAGLMAVVKSDAYGHGLLPCAVAALTSGADWLAVVRVAEALELRRAGIQAPLLCVMSVPGGPHDEAIRNDVDLSVSTVGLLREIAAAARRAGRPARLHLKADTGMSRGGATMAQWPGLVDAALAEQAEGTVEVVGLWSHLACADIPGHPSVQVQLGLFRDAVAMAERAGARPQVRHLANTPATLTLSETWFDLVRTGGGVYGLSTLPGGPPDWLRPAMSVRSRLVQVKQVAGGTGVSYGHRYVAAMRATLGLIPVGYAEGVPRNPAAALEVGVRGHRWPVAGTVSMNHCIIDFGEGPVAAEVAEGDEVTLFGPGDAGEPTVQDWADALGMVSYEVVTRFGALVPRSYFGVIYEDGPWHGDEGSWQDCRTASAPYAGT
ncbi:MAG TPA: alanine racemase [Streptosporangiaceae bacterium]|nr:alanine racemase [Streptosporangiaceae bacterium]